MVALPAPNPYHLVHIAGQIDRGHPLSDDDRTSSAAILGARSIVNAHSDPDAALAADADAPGYLRRTMRGREVFVPAHLAPVFPGGSVLEDVVETATLLTLCHGHPICLSGSTTFLGASKSVSDLDFCEYFLSSATLIPAAVHGKISGSRRGPLVRFKCGASMLSAPWDGFEENARTLLAADRERTSAIRLKLDFLHTTRTFGLMPTTSVVLPIHEDDPEGGSAQFSFAYQEAVITIGRPPRSLLSGDRLARYLLWLRGDIREWLGSGGTAKTADAPLKALKRALSFLLAVGRDDLVAPCVEVLASTEIADVSLKDRVADLRSFVAVAADDFRGHLEEEIGRMETSQTLPTDAQYDEALLGARELAEELLEEIDMMFEAAA